MARPEWGTKRICLSCAARFYDFARSPILCPACGATFDLETASRVRRARPIPRDDVEPRAVIADDPELVAETGVAEEAELEDEEADAADPAVIEEAADEDEEDGHLIEDTGDLGDDDDVSDVIDEDLDEDPDAQR